MDLITTILDASLHDRRSFDCDVPELNSFLKEYAKQNQEKNISKTYVAIYPEPKALAEIIGYYTLSAGEINCDEWPEAIKAKLPKYPIPIARIGRLAVDKNYKGQGVGSFLLYDALTRVLDIAEKFGVFAVVVDAKNDEAKSFYQRYGFVELQASGLTLFLPIKTIKSAKR